MPLEFLLLKPPIVIEPSLCSSHFMIGPTNPHGSDFVWCPPIVFRIPLVLTRSTTLGIPWLESQTRGRDTPVRTRFVWKCSRGDFGPVILPQLLYMGGVKVKWRERVSCMSPWAPLMINGLCYAVKPCFIILFWGPGFAPYPQLCFFFVSL